MSVGDAAAPSPAGGDAGYRLYSWFMWAMPSKTRTENVPAPPELDQAPQP